MQRQKIKTIRKPVGKSRYQFLLKKSENRTIVHVYDSAMEK